MTTSLTRFLLLAGGLALAATLQNHTVWAQEDIPPGEVEPNDNPGRANEILLDTDLACTVKVGGDRDVFRLKIDHPMFLRISVTAAEGVDFSLTLANSERRQVANLNGQGTGRPEELTQRVRRDVYVLSVIARVKEPLQSEASYTLGLYRAQLESYEPSMEGIRAAIARGLDWQAANQEEDGTWEVKRGDHGVTGLALMGFVAEKRRGDREVIEKAAEVFRRAYVPPGTLQNARMEAISGGALVPSSGHFMYEHAIGVLAMSEYVHHGGQEGDREMVKAGVDLLLRSQATRSRPVELGGPVDEKQMLFGGWRYRPNSGTSDLSASGWCLIALEAARAAGLAVPESARQDYMVLCRRCFNEKASAYTYEPGKSGFTNTTNAVGVLTTLLCKGGDCPVVRFGLRTIRRSLPCWEVEGSKGRYPFYYWYYASRAMYMAGGTYWKEWRAVICPMLLRHQSEDGSWDANLDEEKVGVPYTTSLAILILQLCSGNPPAYLRGLELEVKNYPCPNLVDDIEDLLRIAKRDRRSSEDLIRQIMELIDLYRGE